MTSFRLFLLLSAWLLIGGLPNATAQEAPANFWAYTNRQFPYDREARMQRMSGTGVFQLRIDQKTGKVTAVAVAKAPVGSISIKPLPQRLSDGGHEFLFRRAQ